MKDKLVLLKLNEIGVGERKKPFTFRRIEKMEAE
jgi:hypothetical protein